MPGADQMNAVDPDLPVLMFKIPKFLQQKKASCENSKRFCQIVIKRFISHSSVLLTIGSIVLWSSENQTLVVIMKVVKRLYDIILAAVPPRDDSLILKIHIFIWAYFST